MMTFDPYAPLSPRVAEKLTRQSLVQRALAVGAKQQHMNQIVSVLSFGGDVDDKLATLKRTRKEWFR